VGEAANSLALYLRMVALSVRAQLQYRVAFALMVFGSFVASAVEAVGIWALFERFGTLGQWRLAEVAFLYGLVNAAFATCEALGRGFDVFARDFVKTGAFDRLLLRPRSTVLQLAGHELQLHRIGRLAQGVLILGWAIWMLEIDWQPWRVLLLAVTLLAALAFFYGLFVIQATLAFWTTESLELMNTLTYGGTETAQYPLAIYRPWFRRFFTYIVPLGCISYFPSLAILGIPDPLGTSRSFQVAAPLAGFAFLAAALGFWRLGIRRYTSTGS
jgi:ABC-2 type transport system permease protein